LAGMSPAERSALDPLRRVWVRGATFNFNDFMN
jgi:hypothetical protein